MKKTLKGYIAHFTDEVGINRAHKMNAYRMDDVITEIKRIYGNVYFYSIKHGATHGKSNWIYHARMEPWTLNVHYEPKEV